MKFRAMFIAMTRVSPIIAAFLLSGCSKQVQQPATPKSVGLGVVELSYNTPSRHDLGDGGVCVLTAAPLDRESFELSAILEKSGKKVASTRVAPAMVDQPLEISFGDIRIG